jgi:hypothetical protein
LAADDPVDLGISIAHYLLGAGKVDPGLLLVDGEVQEALPMFEAITRHRHFEREMNPPAVCHHKEEQFYDSR